MKIKDKILYGFSGILLLAVITLSLVCCSCCSKTGEIKYIEKIDTLKIESVDTIYIDKVRYITIHHTDTLFIGSINKLLINKVDTLHVDTLLIKHK